MTDTTTRLLPACACGCGGRVTLRSKGCSQRGRHRGEPNRYINGHHPRRPLIERITDKIDVQSNGCWRWTGSSAHGYGQVWIDGTMKVVHRLMWELCVGPIPDNKQIHHRCRHRWCVNPSHMSTVTAQQHAYEHNGIGARNGQKTHCPKRHPYDETNTIYYQGHRYCRECKNERARRKRREHNQ